METSLRPSLLSCSWWHFAFLYSHTLGHNISLLSTVLFLCLSLPVYVSICLGLSVSLSAFYSSFSTQTEGLLLEAFPNTSGLVQ